MRPARWKKALLFLGVLAGTVLAAEVGYRLWLRSRGEPYSGWETRERIAGLRDVARNYVQPTGEERPARTREPQSFTDRLHPFYAFEREAEPEQLERDLATQAKRPGDLRLLVLGGSVGAIFCGTGTERLIELLQADPLVSGRRVHLLRYARAGFKQPQQLTMLSFLLSLGIVPHAVLVIDGYNELAVGSDNFEVGVHPVYPGRRKWLALTATGAQTPELLDRRRQLEALQQRFVARAEAAADSRLLASAVLGRWILARLDALRLQWTRGQEAYVEAVAAGRTGDQLRGPDFDGDQDDALAFLVRLWRESSRSIRAVCDARGIRYLHVLQPALHDVGSKPPREDELSVANVPDIWERSVRLGYPMLRAAGAELAADGESFLDASRVFADVDEKLYRDACHFNERGNELLAEFIAPALLELLREPEPR